MSRQRLFSSFEASDAPVALDTSYGRSARALIEDDRGQHRQVRPPTRSSTSPRSGTRLSNAQRAKQLVSLGCSWGSHRPLSEQERRLL